MVSATNRMIFKHWDDKCVVYHPESGNSHLLPAANAKLLELLRSSTPRDEIIEYVLDELLVPNRKDAIALIEEVTQSYRQLNLLN
jgi:PqqD family protein of HPr-rel-A system